MALVSTCMSGVMFNLGAHFTEYMMHDLFNLVDM